LLFNLYDLDQGADDFSACVGVGLIESLADLVGEIVEAAEDHTQVIAFSDALRCRRRFLLQTLESLFSLSYSRLELTLVQQAVFIGIDQAADAALGSSDLFLKLGKTNVGFVLSRQPALELAPQLMRVLQDGTNVGPRRRVEPVHSHRLVVTDARATTASCWPSSGCATAWKARRRASAALSPAAAVLDGVR